jgi:alkanesulfonate monooxygenase SsuD/methylene tetrahydromethanopterin reductase-like flavin-dependent oxidoreductase (luciferase family)
VIRGLWESDGPFSYAGQHYSLTDSPALPKPAQAHVPVVVGGFGAKRTPRIAATWADEYNVPFHTVEETAAAFERVRAAAALTGRDVVLSAAQAVAVGKDEAQVAARAAAIGHDPARLPLAGTPAQVVDALGRFAEAGAVRVYLQLLDLQDLDHLELVAQQVMPQLA